MSLSGSCSSFYRLNLCMLWLERNNNKKGRGGMRGMRDYHHQDDCKSHSQWQAEKGNTVWVQNSCEKIVSGISKCVWHILNLKTSGSRNFTQSFANSHKRIILEVVTFCGWSLQLLLHKLFLGPNLVEMGGIYSICFSKGKGDKIINLALQLSWHQPS